MITVTEFSGNLLRTAAKAVPTVKHAAPAPVAAEAPAPDAAAPAETVESAEAAPPPAEPPAAPAADTNLSPERIKAVCDAMSVDDNRASRLLEALQAVGSRLERVRQVRVVKPEGAPSHGVKVGEFVYLVDLIPSAEKPGKPGRGDRDRGGRRGPRKGGGGGEKKDESLTGRFSMDSLREDRKKEGGPGGGGRGRRGPPRS